MQGNPSCDIIPAESGALCAAACLYTFVGTPLSQIGRVVFVDSLPQEAPELQLEVADFVLFVWDSRRNVP